MPIAPRDTQVSEAVTAFQGKSDHVLLGIYEERDSSFPFSQFFLSVSYAICTITSIYFTGPPFACQSHATLSSYSPNHSFSWVYQIC